eukprot:CAMPEP_0183715532 /NCGR_PEP_ID=MMETSP0737-20130205/9704_1 /TAXON_ID=385413 /ORGANISM="Thalassiosira miniscula, Strain CCMP1093" /LENGTH=76 /DNA_ID=CAMNT_0025944627 /DNA_START=173 /DNA_END=404 /DNA_ORIENTATION=-
MAARWTLSFYWKNQFIVSTSDIIISARHGAAGGTSVDGSGGEDSDAGERSFALVLDALPPWEEMAIATLQYWRPEP